MQEVQAVCTKQKAGGMTTTVAEIKAAGGYAAWHRKEMAQTNKQGKRNGFKRPRPLHNPGKMNKTEAKYAREVLEPMLRTGEIVSYKFEAHKFRLADKTFYTPDFEVVYPDRIEYHEVKGYWEDDARVKVKVVAETFPHFGFVAIQHVKGQWKRELFGSLKALESA